MAAKINSKSTELSAKEVETRGGKFLIVEHEAPYNLADARIRQEWVCEGKPFFESTIYDFWKIYSEFIPLPSNQDPASVLMPERNAFIRKPVYVGTDSMLRTVGGLWLDLSINGPKSDNKRVRLYGTRAHILVMPGHQGLSDELFKFCVERNPQYDYFIFDWRARAPHENPINFFRRNEFKVKLHDTGGYAVFATSDSAKDFVDRIFEVPYLAFKRYPQIHEKAKKSLY